MFRSNSKQLCFGVVTCSLDPRIELELTDQVFTLPSANMQRQVYFKDVQEKLENKCQLNVTYN